jgi:cell division protein FtsB
MDNAELQREIERLTEENTRLKQEIAKLRNLKRPAAKSIDSMSTKLKEALRE